MAHEKVKPYDIDSDPAAGVKIQQMWSRQIAHKQATDAGGYEKHGANAVPIKKGSSAKAPHDAVDGM